jgi:hypothetical protein
VRDAPSAVVRQPARPCACVGTCAVWAPRPQRPPV